MIKPDSVQASSHREASTVTTVHQYKLNYCVWRALAFKTAEKSAT